MKRTLLVILSMVAAVGAGFFCMHMVYAAYETPIFDGWVLKLSPDSTLEEYINVPQREEIEIPSRAKRADGSVVVPILMYHHVRVIQPWHNGKERLYTVTPDVFEQQMEAIADAGYDTITPDDLAKALENPDYPLPPKPILLTFDDGHREHYTIVYPILKHLNLKDEMIREVSDSGLITIGSHTRRHAALTRLGAEARKDEIGGSKQDLESLLGKAITSIAYPYGYQNAAIQKEAESMGYLLGLGIGPGSVHAKDNRYNLRRIQINQTTNVVKAIEKFSNAK